MSIAPANVLSIPAGELGVAVDDASDVGVSLDSLRRFTVEEYHELIDNGYFAEDEAYELLEGLLVHKMGKKRRHTLATQRLRELLQPMLKGFYVDAQEPVTTGDSEPEPDTSIVRGRREDYRDNQPLAQDVVLVAEVAGGSLSRDRRLKKRIYARAGIPVYWLVNLDAQQIEVYAQPSGPTEKPDYQQCQIIAADGELPVVIDGAEVGRLAVRDILS
jgi:Uma2 family endonuclease